METENCGTVEVETGGFNRAHGIDWIGGAVCRDCITLGQSQRAFSDIRRLRANRRVHRTTGRFLRAERVAGRAMRLFPRALGGLDRAIRGVRRTGGGR